MSLLVSTCIAKGTLAALPAASIHGRLYFATDVHKVYSDTGIGWEEVTPSSAAFSTPPATLDAPNGSASYTLPAASVNPTGSVYFVNGIKRIYGTYYTITGGGLTLTILATVPPQIGDTHEIYYS